MYNIFMSWSDTTFSFMFKFSKEIKQDVYQYFFYYLYMYFNKVNVLEFYLTCLLWQNCFVWDRYNQSWTTIPESNCNRNNFTCWLDRRNNEPTPLTLLASAQYQIRVMVRNRLNKTSSVFNVENIGNLCLSLVIARAFFVC
jgi:hypothetical protein